STQKDCYAPCNVTCPQPIVDTCNEPCITSCSDSRAVVYPPLIVVTFPGTLLSFCPQESVEESSAHGLSCGYCSPYSYRGFNGYHSGSCGPC
uniref:Keratin n=1 Tax=Chrysemys picta bellii TaxID=8478 RepID=A0A8C3IS25_CHRPI